MNRFDYSYMRMAQIWAQNSHSKRHKVGTLIVKDNAIVADGFNGTPSGMDNSCEDEDGATHWYVIHSESNALMKLAKSSGASSAGATLYVTLSPCRECSKLILQSGIVRVVYLDAHSDTSGLIFLKEKGVLVEKIDFDNEKNI
jgi:dCMP deaminase